MFRKSVFFVLAVLLSLGSVTFSFADTANLAPDSSETKPEAGISAAGITNAAANKTWTLSEAMETALQNNIDILRAGLEYEKAITEMEQAQYNAEGIDANSVTSLGTAQTKYVSSKQKELAEKIAKQAYEIAREQTKIQVEKTYYDVLKAENLVKAKEASVQRTQEQLNLVQKKFKSGAAVKTDVNRAEVSLASARADLANAQRDLKNAQVTFNKTLGLALTANVKLAPVLKYEQASLPAVEELSRQALENRLEIQRARNSETIAKLNYDLAVRYLAANTYTARNYKTELEKAKLDVKQQEQNAQAEVISTIFQVQKADEVVRILTNSLEQAKANHSLAKRRYEIGVGTLVDVLTASVDLADTEAKYIEAVYNYTLAKKQLQTVVLVSK